MTQKKHKQTPIKNGSFFGEWKLVEQIDEGGNGYVWQAHKSCSEIFAIKILKDLTEEKYARFSSEIEVVNDNSGIPGVLEIVEAFLPDFDEKKRPWFVMPIAQPMTEFLERKSSPEIVEEFIKLGETFKILHSRTIAHRDIKPENILALHGRLYISDFGLVKYPESPNITLEKRDVGAKFTMAPEMRRVAHKADGLPADVYSFAKTLWIALTGVPLGFDGQYTGQSDLGLKNHLGDLYVTTLDELLTNCTEEMPAKRPKIDEVVEQLRQWLELIGDFHKQNLTEWSEAAQSIFPLAAPDHATWKTPEDICKILDRIANINGLNHLFFPSGGGNTITSAKLANEDGFIEIHATSPTILKPKKLTFESFGLDPNLNYFRLEAEEIKSTGLGVTLPDGYVEYLTELSPGEYAHPDFWEYRYENDEGRSLPDTARGITRSLKGSFVIFSTRSRYNLTSATYDARHDKASEERFREYIEVEAKREKAENRDD